MEQVFSGKFLQVLAIDLGLLILLGWFLILLLIIREFRQFATNIANGNKEQDNKTLEMCQRSIDSALNYIGDHANTLNELIRVQQLLEKQVINIKESTDDHISKEEKQELAKLNAQLKLSHQLIRKLKGDLDSSVKRLGKTREKLYAQYDQVEILRREKEELEKKVNALENAPSGSGHWMGQDELKRQHQNEKESLLKALAQYKRQMAEQEQAISQLMTQTDNQSDEQLAKLQTEIVDMQRQLTNMNKEKDFVEKKFLELLNEVEKNNKSAS